MKSNVTAIGTGDPVPYISEAAVSVRYSDGRTESWTLYGDIMKGSIQKMPDNIRGLGGVQVAFIFDAPSRMEHDERPAPPASPA